MTNKIEYSYREWNNLTAAVVGGTGEYLGLGHMSYGDCGCKVWSGGADDPGIIHRPCAQHVGKSVEVKCSNVH